MKLIDARRLAVRNQVRIGFRLSNGMECLINEHGISQAPGLASAPEFNLEDEFARADRFTLAAVKTTAKRGASDTPRTVTREELEALAGEKAQSAEHTED